MQYSNPNSTNEEKTETDIDLPVHWRTFDNAPGTPYPKTMRMGSLILLQNYGRWCKQDKDGRVLFMHTLAEENIFETVDDLIRDLEFATSGFVPPKPIMRPPQPEPRPIQLRMHRASSENDLFNPRPALQRTSSEGNIDDVSTTPKKKPNRFRFWSKHVIS